MMRAAAISTISYAVMMMFQNVDLFVILDKYGLPLALAAGIFIYLSREIKQVRKDKATSDQENDTLRQLMLDEQKTQTEYLRNLLSEAKTANVICRYNADTHTHITRENNT